MFFILMDVNYVYFLRDCHTIFTIPVAAFLGEYIQSSKIFITIGRFSQTIKLIIITEFYSFKFHIILKIINIYQKKKTNYNMIIVHLNMIDRVERSNRK